MISPYSETLCVLAFLAMRLCFKNDCPAIKERGNRRPVRKPMSTFWIGHLQFLEKQYLHQQLSVIGTVTALHQSRRHVRRTISATVRHGSLDRRRSTRRLPVQGFPQSIQTAHRVGCNSKGRISRPFILFWHLGDVDSAEGCREPGKRTRS